MRVIPVTLLVLMLGVSGAGQSQSPQAGAASATPTAAQAESTAKSFLQALGAADVSGMKDHFADTVEFVGDLRFLGEPAGSRGPKKVTRDQIAAAYTRLFGAMGREKWIELTKPLQPTLTRAAKDAGHPDDVQGELPPAFVKTGEYLYELRFPGKTGLDDILLFVLRPIDGKWKIVAHWADY